MKQPALRLGLPLLGLIASCGPAQDAGAQAVATPPQPAQQMAASAAAAALPPPADAPRLAFPLACTIGETCAVQNYVDRDPGPEARDYRCGRQTYEAHNGVDIRLLDMAAQRAGVDVLAAAPGRVARLRDGVADISVKAPGAPSVAGQECGNGVVIDHGAGWETQYCHLARGSIRVKAGDQVAAGDPIARVGLSGNTEYPHLHVTLRKAGAVVDPFAPGAAPGACAPAPGATLWTADAARALAYQPGVVLNAGFAAAAVTMEAVEAGAIPPPDTASPALLAYVRAANLQGGDVQKLTLKGPGGEVLASSALPPLDRAKAQYLMYAGKRPPPGGWPRGRYVAVYTVERGGGVALARTFEMRL